MQNLGLMFSRDEEFHGGGDRRRACERQPRVRMNLGILGQKRWDVAQVQWSGFTSLPSLSLNRFRSNCIRGAFKIKKWEKLVFWTNRRTPPPSPRKLVHLKVKKNFDVYFAFQTILSILIFHENVPFWGAKKLGQGNPPPSLENCPNFGPTFPVSLLGGPPGGPITL